MRDGDEIVVSSLDRLSGSTEDIENIMGKIRDRGATLTILNLPTFKGIEPYSFGGARTSISYSIV
ncbi:hypothetical protein KIMC2_16720 [Xylocopilactobacillus apis]|uniref:Resolvase/invertase-type recombinase catalytic domain-containing protein n=1 Tax=Xylocopilactobacillus apis TaxID=2932183 RepID=A0AAU9D448_9LACO|nr:hypothetical protein KIMC2_16720 [Xylocopilactobacillus apis]